MQDVPERESISSPIRSSEPVPCPVSPETFMVAMTERWDALGNTPSAQLKQIWRTMAATFSGAIMAHDRVWRVLQPPTGTGKTQGLCVYAALTITKNLASPAPTGILVVTRTIQQADEIVDTIRPQLSAPAADCVQAKHSKSKPGARRMRPMCLSLPTQHLREDWKRATPKEVVGGTSTRIGYTVRASLPLSMKRCLV